MPTFVKGNMWDVFGKTDLFLITTNPIVRKDGAAVMGRGIAKQAATKYPELPYDFGRKLTYHIDNFPDDPVHGLNIVIGKYDGQRVGNFMVKEHWADNAVRHIIKSSVASLLRVSDQYTRIDLNFPGIGNGKLRREDVLPLLQVLPDNVHIWEYE